MNPPGFLLLLLLLSTSDNSSPELSSPSARSSPPISPLSTSPSLGLLTRSSGNGTLSLSSAASAPDEIGEVGVLSLLLTNSTSSSSLSALSHRTPEEPPTWSEEWFSPLSFGSFPPKQATLHPHSSMFSFFSSFFLLFFSSFFSLFSTASLLPASSLSWEGGTCQSRRSSNSP